MTTIYVPNAVPVKGSAFTFYTSLISQADTDIFQVNPTFAPGDVKVWVDGVAFGNIDTLPVVTPAGGRTILVTLSIAEMTGNKVVVLFSDAADNEWQDGFVEIITQSASGSAYITNAPFTKNATYTFYLSLISQANINIFQANPTLAAGDIKVSIDGGAFGNVTVLPTAIAASKVLSVPLSAAEMNGNRIAVQFSDVAGAEWQDAIVTLDTEVATVVETTVATGIDISMIPSVTFAQTITGLTIPATWSKIYFTMKQYKDDIDAWSILQIVDLATPDAAIDGITYINKVAATVTTRAYGSLTINQVSGTVAVLVTDDGTNMLPDGKYSFDIKALLADGSSQLLSTSANCIVSYTDTWTL